MKSKTIPLFAAAVMALAFVAIGSAGPGDVTVGTCDHATFTTIQAAVTAAASGTKITVCPGTYTEQVTIPAGKDNLTLQSKMPLTAIIQAPAVMSPTKAIVQISSQNVTLKQFTIQGPGSGPCDSLEYGVRVDGGGSATIQQNHITHIRDTPFSGCQNGVAIQVGREADATTGSATIKDNQIDDYQKNGITVSNTGSNATVQHNTVVGAGPTAVIAQNGIQVSDGATADVRDNTVSNNAYTPQTVVSTGILLYSAGATNVEHNTVSDSDVGIYVYLATASAPVSVKNNETSGGAFDGIDLASSSGATLENNRTHDNTYDGIYLNDTGSGNTLKNNEAKSNGEDGINLDAATNNSLQNNKTEGNVRDGIHAATGSTGNTLTNNQAKSNTALDCHDQTTGTGTAGTGNTWLNDKGVTSDPPGICKR